MEIERKGITEDDIFTPGAVRSADIKQKQAEEDIMYQKYGKTRAKGVGMPGTPGEFKEKWITDPGFKSGVDEQLKAFGDYMGYGWTPYGLGYGMQQMKPGIGDKKYNKDLGYRQLIEFMDYQNSMENIAQAGGVSKMAGGGIVGIRKPSALPPTGGPMSQGLRSLYINDKDY